MTTSIRLPDGSTVKIATSDPKQAAAAARKIWEKRQSESVLPAKRQPLTGLQTTGAFAGNMLDNVLPNWGDEIYGAGHAAKAFVTGEDTGAAFRAGQQSFKDLQEQFGEEHPHLKTASTVAGVGASLLIPAGTAIRGASLAGRLTQGAIAGGALGALSGAGEGETLGERASNAGTSGLIGAGVGVAAEPVLRGGQAAIRTARNVIPGADETLRRLGNIPRAVLNRPLARRGDAAQQQANQILGRRLNQGEIVPGFGQPGTQASPAALLAEMQRRQNMNVPAVLGDLTDDNRTLLASAARGMGPGQMRVRQSLNERKSREAERVRQHVIDEFGPVGDPIRQMDDHLQQTREAVAPMYRAAYAEPVVITPEIASIMRTPAFRDALPEAVTTIRNRQGDPQALGFIMDSQGNIDPEAVQTLSMEGFDHVIRAMQRQARSLGDANPITGRVAHNSVSSPINDRAMDLRSHFKDQNEPYRDAVNRFGDDAAHRDAFASGRDVGSLTGHEINAQARSIPQAAQPAWDMGARTSLADAASSYGAKYRTGDTANHVRQMLGDRTKQEAIGQITGNTGAVQGLMGRLEAEQQAGMAWREVFGNSATQSRAAVDRELADEIAGGRLPPMSVRGFAQNMAERLMGSVTPQYRRDVQERIATVLSEQNPRTVEEFMGQIQAQAARDEDFALLLQRAGILGARAYGGAIEPQE